MKRWLTILLAVSVLSACKTPGVAEGVVELRREELAVSMLVVNLRDAYNEPNERTPHGISWQRRFSRVAEWIALNDPPDVLVIQEMPGYWNGGLVQDYEAAHYLIDEIRRRRQVEYRIAYLLSAKQGAGSGDWYVGLDKRGTLPARSGHALLYRADKIRNAQRDAGLAFDTAGNADSGLMNSVPCCNLRSGTEAVCGLIDGPLVRAQVDTLRSGPIRSCDTPAGGAFTRRQSTPGGPTDAVFSRLELKNQPGNFVHIYNVHFDFAAGPDANLERLVNDMEQRFASAGRLLYPPIIAGDFNLDRAAMDVRFEPGRSSFYPRLTVLHWSPELMGVLIGTDEAFPSKQRVIVRGKRDLPAFGCKPNPDPRYPPIPSDPLTLWSDHCGSIYFRVLPVLDRPN